MNKKSAITVITIAFFIINNFVYGQNTAKQSTKYYWFEVSVNLLIDQKTKKPRFNVNKVHKMSHSGSFYEFVEFYKKSLQKNKIAIGPFSNKSYLRLAKKAYALSKLNDEEANKLIKKHTEGNLNCYWYNSSIHFEKPSGDIQLYRTPARVAPGNVTQFMEFFYEALRFEKFAVGPFQNQIDAEKSKYISRKYGEAWFKGSEKNKPGLSLKRMSEKWQEVRIEVYEAGNKGDSAINDKKVKIKFPSNYFYKENVQYVKIEIKCDNKIIPIQNTFQGEAYKDNNVIIPYKSGRNYIFKAQLPGNLRGKLNLVINSTIFSDKHMLECKTIEKELLLE